MRTAILFISVVVCAQAADIPRTLVSDDEADPIHSAIIRKEAWTLDPVRRLRADAEKRVKEGPWTVTSERPKDLEMDPHDYYSEAPYWWPNPENPSGPYIRKDGQFNPARFLANKTALNSMADAVFTLGAAAYFLDEPRYAQRAARDIRVWFIDPKTRMNPSLEYSQAIRGVNDGRGAGIIDGRVLIRAIQGMEFLAQTGQWDAKDQLAVHKWFDEYLHWLTHSENGEDEQRSGNNHASWWTAQVAAVASFVENKGEEKIAFDYYRDHIFSRQIRPDGSAPREEARTRSLSYSAFNLEALYDHLPHRPSERRRSLERALQKWRDDRRGPRLSRTVPYRPPQMVEGADLRVPQRRPLLPGFRRYGPERNPNTSPSSGN